MITFPFETEALRVEQPLGTFFVAVLPANLLLQIAISDVMRATLNPDGIGYTLTGTQRLIQDARLRQIAEYIGRADAAFPNTIILAANYNSDTGLDQEEAFRSEAEESADGPDGGVPLYDLSDLWEIIEGQNGSFRLRIPTEKKLAAIIDGQHRLFAFAKADPRRLNCDLVCSIFLDLPRPYQAQLFATINSTQKAVDKSLTYELFGYNIADEAEPYWTPDKLAVFLTRKLGTDPDSVLFSRIIVAPKRDKLLEGIGSQALWKISTAVVVNGIVRLISSNPKRDANIMRAPEMRPRTVLRDGPRDRSPLRAYYIEGNDVIIYTLVKNYLRACENLFWSRAGLQSYIQKTVGVQALFDVLKGLVPKALERKDISVAFFEGVLRPAGEIDFAAQEFRVPAGAGRLYIRKAIEARLSVPA
ncbi:DGQHR domain-containing protein [Roseicella aerolata]|uniref:DGQHR domain-containing protein n=1 Tax=Roseicella aerolata TaxID=2883479 RepID=A0A9X1IIP6_9PROT|nr:DGQHR domain-containing protein [Roseicella aerolata]MCB4825357.1 DGQHR domain-containing protein [Roseicella aerolata]